MAVRGPVVDAGPAGDGRYRPDLDDDSIDIRTAPIPVGVPVEVRNRFDDRWTHGFSVAMVGDGSYQLRRSSDGSVLPAWFPAAMIRPDQAG
jgi:hypothetical protein